MPHPDEQTCLGLLDKYDTPRHIISHSRTVWRVARVLGASLSAGRSIDMDLLRAACLLHDIAKYPCILDGYRYHDRRGEEILCNEGLPSVGRIVVQHVHLHDPYAAQLREEHLVFYADKRVRHDEVVSIGERFRYLRETYGKTTEAIERLNEMKRRTLTVERRIFRDLSFAPDDVAALIDEDD